MAVSLPNGSTFHIASGTGSDLTVTAATNASPCVMTSTAHGLANGGIVIVTSGWGRISNRVFRVANITANTFELENSNTSDTDAYPAGSGVGSVKEVTGWTQLQQVTDPQSQGGEQQFVTYQFVEDLDETRIPTNRSAAGLNMSVGDDPTLAGHILATTADEDRVPRAIRVSAANGSKSYYYAYITIGKTPTMNVNQIMTVPVTMSFVNPSPVRYSA